MQRPCYISGDYRKMAIDQCNSALKNLHPLVDRNNVRCTSVMHDRRFRRDAGPCTSQARPQAKIGFLAIHEKCGIEPLQLTPKLAINQEETACNNIDVSRSVPIPSTVCFGIEERASATKISQAKSEAGKI